MIPQELLNTARHHCEAIQTIIDQLRETKSNPELRLLSQALQRLAFHARRGVAMVDAASKKAPASLRVTFVYSKLELKGELIAVLFDAATTRSLFRARPFAEFQGGSRARAA